MIDWQSLSYYFQVSRLRGETQWAALPSQRARGGGLACRGCWPCGGHHRDGQVSGTLDYKTWSDWFQWLRNGRPSGRADAIFASSREARRLLNIHVLNFQCQLISTLFRINTFFFAWSDDPHSIHSQGRWENAQERSGQQVKFFFPHSTKEGSDFSNPILTFIVVTTHY